MSKNKLKAEKNYSSLIVTVAILSVFLIIAMIYGTYIYICYTADGKAIEMTAESLNAFSQSLMNPLKYFPLKAEAVKKAILWQTTKFWWLYGGIVLAIFLKITTPSDNDYKGTEYGSATWADKQAEKSFRDKTGIPIGKGFYVTITNPKGKFYKPNNLNEIVIGGSGAGKSFRKIKPDIMQMYGSYVVTDPKGELYRDTAKVLTANGYKVRVLNLENINLSNAYNPFCYMVSEQDVLNVADLFMKNSAGEGEKEDFWSGSAQDLLVMIMLYLYKSEYELKSFGRVIRLVNSIKYTKEGKIDELCELARCMTEHSIDFPDDAASVNWKSITGTPQETMGSIAKTLSTRLRLWAVSDVDELTADDEMDFDHVGQEKTAIFLIIPPARQTYKAVANIFYSQLFERLMWVANNKCNGRLPYLVSCELDEFANIGKIPNFCETLAVVRSHNIRICIVLQGLSQLKALYEKTFESIIGNCSMFTFLGTNDADTKEYVSKRLGKTTVKVRTRSYNRGGTQGGGSDSESYVARDLLAVEDIAMAMRPRGKTNCLGGSCIAFIDHFRPFFIGKFDTLSHPLISSVGSSFPKDFKNNTDINEVYGKIKEERSQKYSEQRNTFEEVFRQKQKDFEEQKEKENAEFELEEQKKLEETFGEAEDFEELDDFGEDRVEEFMSIEEE